MNRIEAAAIAREMMARGEFDFDVIEVTPRGDTHYADARLACGHSLGTVKSQQAKRERCYPCSAEWIARHSAWPASIKIRAPAASSPPKTMF